MDNIGRKNNLYSITKGVDDERGSKETSVKLTFKWAPPGAGARFEAVEIRVRIFLTLAALALLGAASLGAQASPTSLRAMRLNSGPGLMTFRTPSSLRK